MKNFGFRYFTFDMKINGNKKKECTLCYKDFMVSPNIKPTHALWCPVLFNEFKIPDAYKPTALIRELRKLLTQLNLLNQQLRSIRNNI